MMYVPLVSYCEGVTYPAPTRFEYRALQPVPPRLQYFPEIRRLIYLPNNIFKNIFTLKFDFRTFFVPSHRPTTKNVMHLN